MASISRLEDKVAVLTGAARGIGLACAQRFAAEGAAVVLADRDEKAGAAAAASIPGAEFVGGDVSRKADVEAIVKSVLDRHGRVDVLVNNAGITHACDFLDLEEADFDRVLVNYFADEFKKEHGIDVTSDNSAMQRLRDEAEKAKIELSTTNEVDVNLPFLTADAEGPKHFEHKLTRAKLESLVADLIEKTVEPSEKALKDAKLKASDINAVVLVGGMTRMPAVVEKVKKIFGKDPKVKIVGSAMAAVEGAEALAIVTEWQEFRSPDFAALKSKLGTPAIFDGRNLYDPAVVLGHGLEYFPIGRRA